jgi:hypothetical protein
VSDNVLSHQQLHILKHSLGWPKCYRNHFVTGEGSKDYENCEELLRRGFMKVSKRDWIVDNIYVVTDEGKKIVEKYEK